MVPAAAETLPSAPSMLGLVLIVLLIARFHSSIVLQQMFAPDGKFADLG